jgi:hypothetical protein
MQTPSKKVSSRSTAIQGLRAWTISCKASRRQLGLKRGSIQRRLDRLSHGFAGNLHSGSCAGRLRKVDLHNKSRLGDTKDIARSEFLLCGDTPVVQKRAIAAQEVANEDTAICDEEKAMAAAGDGRRAEEDVATLSSAENILSGGEKKTCFVQLSARYAKRDLHGQTFLL